MAASNTVYLISGANRGIGLEFAKQLSERPNTVVFAGARNPKAATDLQALSEKHPGRVHVVELKACDEQGNARVVEEIRQKVGQLDVVIANAAIFNDVKELLNVSPQAMREHFDVNVVGTLVLFQAAYPLMKTSPTRKFVVIGAKGGSITLGPEYRSALGPYAVSKAAVHYVAKKLQFENEEFVIFPICPGRVSTDMYLSAQNKDAELAKHPGATPAYSVASMLRVIDGATRENAGGKFMDVSGGVNEW
ncbi:NAD(P)-binding protein [Schizophyllum commune Loenen D]|nr:NAD(P)-binding protein [Schizophyllum commune Loenen D]